MAKKRIWSDVEPGLEAAIAAEMETRGITLAALVRAAVMHELRVDAKGRKVK